MNFWGSMRTMIIRSPLATPARLLKRLLRFNGSDKKHWAYPESKLAHSLLHVPSGLEIGPSTHNPFALNTRNVGRTDPIYEAEHLRITGTFSKINIEADADATPVPDDSEDFVLSSHVIEHCPNFIKTMLEWYRIIKPNGYLFMITPLRDAAPSDRNRPLTTWSHMVTDFINQTTPEKEPEAGVFGHCHYHVFAIDTMKVFLQRIFSDRLELVTSQKRDDKIGNGFTLVYRKTPTFQTQPWVAKYQPNA
jgi:SAM-dependent methyltransferase